MRKAVALIRRLPSRELRYSQKQNVRLQAEIPSQAMQKLNDLELPLKRYRACGWVLQKTFNHQCLPQIKKHEGCSKYTGA